MLELPALALAVAALGVLLLGPRTRWRITEILAGALFSLSILTKLITVIYLPLVPLVLWLRVRQDASASVRGGSAIGPSGPPHDAKQLRRPPSRRPLPGSLVRSLLLFAAVLSVGFVAIEYAIDGGAYLAHSHQWWSSHFAAPASFEYGSANDHPFQWDVFAKNWDTTIPGIVGIAVALRRAPCAPTAMLPVAWFALALIVFSTHTPWWSYYFIHTALPLCWCAGIGIDWALRRLVARRAVGWWVVLGAFAIGAVAWQGVRVYLQVDGIRRSPQLFNALVLKEIARLRPLARFMYTDEPIYSFHAGIPMPPDLAVVPLKRLWAGGMSNQKIVAELGKTLPEVIVLRNGTHETPFAELLATEYRIVYLDPGHRLYLKKALARQAGY